jgi:hypothetical protein
VSHLSLPRRAISHIPRAWYINRKDLLVRRLEQGDDFVEGVSDRWLEGEPEKRVNDEIVCGEGGLKVGDEGNVQGCELLD